MRSRSAPGWLALPEAERAHFARRVGSVMLAPALRLWISAPRVAAARDAVGADWWAALQAHNDWPALPAGMATWPDVGDAAGVGELLRMAGASVLQALLPHGALQPRGCRTAGAGGTVCDAGAAGPGRGAGHMGAGPGLGAAMSFVLWQVDAGVGVASARQVLRADEVAPLQEANALVQALAQACHGQTRRLQNELEAAHRRGLAQGLEDGRRQAQQELAQALAGLEAKAAQERDQQRAAVAALALQVARKILGELPQAERLSALAAHAAQELLPARTLRLHVAPAMLEAGARAPGRTGPARHRPGAGARAGRSRPGARCLPPGNRSGQCRCQPAGATRPPGQRAGRGACTP
jgi:hypothetical protein